ncbi:hypothetical protein ACFYNY_22980 [Streptomyces sp. NPDC006530]|uniref:hypothetical protein n=1 Tax=Streptomyces sp. NPDC006530 TaxID=3364750 RepID=UPI003697F6AF
MRTRVRVALGATIAAAICTAALLDPAAGNRHGASAPPVRTLSFTEVVGDAKACTASREVSIGAGVSALLTLSPAGPRVTFKDGPGRPLPGLGTLDRAHPKAPASAGVRAEILTPYGTAPRLRTKVEGGAAAPYQFQDFPRLPRGCALKGVGTPAA